MVVISIGSIVVVFGSWWLVAGWVAMVAMDFRGCVLFLWVFILF